MTYAVYFKHNNVTQVRYSHLTEQEAIDEVESANDWLRDTGRPQVFWYEEHHPDCTFVYG
jgi:hypothetical protein